MVASQHHTRAHSHAERFFDKVLGDGSSIYYGQSVQRKIEQRRRREEGELVCVMGLL